jgi:hypothetical protein
VERTLPGVDASRDELLPFVGPAASLPLWSLLARLPFDAARSVWLTLLACAWAALLWSALALARVPWNARLTIAGAAIFTGFCGPLISDVALGQAALVSACAVSVAMLALDRRWRIAAIAAACVAAIQPNLAVVLAARATNRRNIVLLGLAAVVFFALTLAIGGGAGGLSAYVHRLAAHGDGERFILIQYSIPAILRSFALSAGTARSAGTIVAALTIAGIASVMLRFRTATLATRAIAIALLPFVIPFFHEHDFVIVLIPVLLLGVSRDTRVRVLAGCGAMCACVDWLGVAQRPHTALMTASLAAAVAFGWPAYSACTRRREFAIPLATCVLVGVIAIPLALAHPATVWPDMLGGFHAAPGADASAVWAAEQQRSGLAALDPAWGVLRAIPLLGCALLAAAGLIATRSPASTDADLTSAV